MKVSLGSALGITSFGGEEKGKKEERAGEKLGCPVISVEGFADCTKNSEAGMALQHRPKWE